jgi:hypothetical protein
MNIEEETAEGSGVRQRTMVRRINTDEIADGQKRLVIKSSAECKMKADGSMHREMTLKFDENGVASQGKFVLDISK